jgi:ribosome-binding factor A
MSKPTFKRSARVADQMKVEIADILMRKIKDPRIGFVTVTEVAVADDLRNATVFISVYDADRATMLKVLEGASAFIRSELGRRMRMRYIPELLFRYDDSLERGNHIMELLRQVDTRTHRKGADDE